MMTRTTCFFQCSVLTGRDPPSAVFDIGFRFAAQPLTECSQRVCRSFRFTAKPAKGQAALESQAPVLQCFFCFCFFFLFFSSRSLEAVDFKTATYISR